MEDMIQMHFVGPDCYWKPDGAIPRGCTRFFGNAWWIPFPPTLVGTHSFVTRHQRLTILQVLQYDNGPQVVLSEVKQLERYIHQNTSEEIMRKRQLRLALRSLEGQVVRWPYDHVQVSSWHQYPIHSHDRCRTWASARRSAAAESVTPPKLRFIFSRPSSRLNGVGVSSGKA